eukprot:356376-Chlamydomonas_euryale.AAC.9
MPECSFFQQGVCSAPDCPYLHVRLAPDTPLCEAFLSGYCPRGRECPRRHVTRQVAKALRQAGGAKVAAGRKNGVKRSGGTPATAPPPGHMAATAAAATARRLGNVTEQDSGSAQGPVSSAGSRGGAAAAVKRRAAVERAGAT